MLKSNTKGTHLWYLASSYLIAKEIIIKEGYGKELGWQERISLDNLTESKFLKESAWVILSSGMKEFVIRKIFSKISEVFFNWESSEKICYNQCDCLTSALNHFNNPRKIKAIIEIAKEINYVGFYSFLKSLKMEGVSYIKKFPFMGPATSYHLAKNIGFNVVKPDRHLVRVAKATGYKNPHEMCSELSNIVGDDIRIIDLVIWRYATLKKDYLKLFSEDFGYGC
jgi:hypothetical protein